MKEFWNKAAMGAVALACAGAANAYVIDFESSVAASAPFAPLLSDGDYYTQGGYAIIGQDGNNTTATPDGTLVGAMVNGADPTTCLDGTCVAGNSGHYMAATNNGVISVQSVTGANLVLSTFSAAFLPASGVVFPATQVAFLAVEADRTDGSYAVGLYTLLGPNATTGLTSFSTFSTASYQPNGGTGTLTSGNINALYFYAFYCNSGSCNAFNSDKGQFALDNITVNVPEPTEWMLMAMGLAGVGAVVRRRRAA